MSDEIIDLTRYLRRESEKGLPRGAMSLWGAEGERSRFALPLWRIIYLARAERGVIAWSAGVGSQPTPFVALDLASEPARATVDRELPPVDEEHEASLHDLGADGIVVHLGWREGKLWSLIVDGGPERNEPLSHTAREDILFLAGECAGLLFLRDLGPDDGT